MKSQLRRDAADEARRRLEPERRPRKGALLALENAEQVYLPRGPEIVACGEPVRGGGRDRERGAFFELGTHLRASPARPAAPARSLKQRVGILELHLARRVIDRVVRLARQQPVPDVDPFAPFPDLEAVQRQHRAVRRRGCRRMQAQREHRRRSLRGEVGARRAIERVVALRCRELARIREGREVRKHNEQIAHRIPLIGIAEPRKQAIVLVELGRIVGQRHAEPLEVGIAGRAALPLVHAQRERHAGAIDLPSPDAIGVANLEAERR